MNTIPRITRSIAKPSAQRRHTAWITNTSMTVSPAPIAAPTPANVRSAGAMGTGPIAVRPTNIKELSARSTRKPATPTTEVGIPETAAKGLSRTREQLK